MAIFDQINKDIMEAMKAKEKERLEALRGIKKVMIEAKSAKGATAELSDAESLQIISKLAKQGRESAAIYQSQGRNDLVEVELAQVAVFETYLPKMMSDEELESALKDIIGRVGAKDIKELGKVMGVASKELAGKADGKAISEKVRTLLQ